MTAKEYQNSLFPKVNTLFSGHEVKNEWAAFTRLIHQYSPRVDIAVGPFNTNGPNLTELYNELVQAECVKKFLEYCFNFHIQNLDITLYDEIIQANFETLIFSNQNARCLIAIEIENRNSKKHIMGSMVNAASLGRVGIGVAFNEGTLKSFCRIANYLAFLKRVEKNSYDTTNFLIVTTAQLDEVYERILREY
ncbi:hypothetical protein [Arcticibacter tournemirensis]